MNTFQKLFHVDLTKRPWLRIILWWELRRILYNVFLLAFGLFSLTLLLLIPTDGYVKLYAGPGLAFGIYVTVLFFFGFANICYTGGWILQLFASSGDRKLKKYFAYLFIYGLVVSFLATLVPVILALLNLFSMVIP